MATLSSETIHANAVAIAGQAVLILGKSGSGKSDLSLRLIDRDARLVSDDHCHLVRRDNAIYASAPERLRGKIEVRGIGICDSVFDKEAPIALIVRLSEQYERIPMDQAQENILGVTLPILRINAYEASAPIKVEWALRQAIARANANEQTEAIKGFASL